MINEDDVLPVDHLDSHITMTTLPGVAGSGGASQPQNKVYVQTTSKRFQAASQNPTLGSPAAKKCLGIKSFSEYKILISSFELKGIAKRELPVLICFWKNVRCLK